MENNSDVIKTLTINDTEITLLGTAHVSRKSVELVEEKINQDDFDIVAVELCPPRYQNLVNDSWWKNLDIFQVLKQGKGSFLLINLALSAYQRRLAEKLEIEPGREMSRAIELASEKNIELKVIDRDISTTLQRMYRRVTFWQKFRLFTSLIASIFVGDDVTEDQIEKLKEGDLLESMMEEFGDALPSVKSVLIDERDQYMVGKLVDVAKEAGEGKKILAIVGAGHLKGMLKTFDSPPDSNRMLKLDERPAKNKTGLYIGWGICLLVLSMFYVGYQRSPEMGWNLVVTWVVLNGGLSALGAAIAFAHPLSVITAFLAAPLTSLNPTIGAGMVVGMMEAWLRKPKVKDFESMRKDVAQFGMWWKNGAIRIFLVFLFANLGSAAGTWIAGFSIASQMLE